MKKLTTKRQVSNILTLLLILSMVFATNVFAEDSKTVEVRGYTYEGMTEEEITAINPHFSVSNVVDTFDVKKIDQGMDAGLITESPATVKLLADGGVLFDVYKLTKNGESYEYDYDKALPISGQVKVYVPDESGALDENGMEKYVEKTIDMTELDKYEVDMPEYLPGCSVTLTEPGDYYVIFRYAAIEGAAQAFIKVNGTTDSDEDTVDSDLTTDTLTAQPTASKVLVNGTETSFDAYMINGNNYFKLRDLAKVVSGTEKQFEVTWDGTKKAINLISNKAYTTVGGEMVAGDGQEKTTVLSTSKIYKDGQEITLTAYTINENNYFKLRDIAKAFDIGVTWDGATSTVGIDTTTGYVEE